MRNSHGPVLVIAAVALLLVLGACGDNSGATTEPTVVFGSGEIPESVPDDFPVPTGAVVGSTLVDGINVRTEFEMRVAQAQADVAQFFTVNLVNSGYVVDDSRLDNDRWTIDFRRNALQGKVSITSPGQGISQIVVEVNAA
jgi:hypothetical protein